MKKFKEREYTYRGRVELSGKPYEEKQPDLKGNIRRVWMFPLRVKGRDHFSIDLTIQRGLEKEKEKKARRGTCGRAFEGVYGEVELWR